MSVAGIFSSCSAVPAQGFYQQRRADLLELSQALRSGDLSAAQEAFSTLAALSLTGSRSAASSSTAASSSADGSSGAATSSTSSSTSGPFTNPQLAQDFNAIGQALQSGDLAGARKAFVTFKQDVQDLQGGSQVQGGGRHHRHHHHRSEGSSSTTSTTPDIILNLGNSGNSGNAEQISLSFTHNGSSGEQLIIAISNGSDSPEQITVNFGSASVPDIILNLGNNGSASAAPATSAQASGASGQLNVTA